METLELIIYPIILFLLGILIGVFGFKSKTNNSTETDKYEVTILCYINEEEDYMLNEMQDKGWEIAGEISTRESIECRIIIIPMKRKIK